MELRFLFALMVSKGVPQLQPAEEFNMKACGMPWGTGKFHRTSPSFSQPQLLKDCCCPVLWSKLVRLANVETEKGLRA